MKLVVVAVAALVSVSLMSLGSGCLISPVIPIGGGKSSKQIQHDRLDQLLPAQITAVTRRSGEVRVGKVRVWADDEYRAQNARWQHGFDEQLDYANQVLVPMLGVRLEAEYRSWERHAPGSPLADALHALAAADPDTEVVFVIGLTSALSLVSGSFEELGIAEVGDRHLVVRGHADLEERKGFERAFPSIDAEQREAVLEARRRHKTTAVLLHELAHSLGALHETEPDWLLNPLYSHRAASISDRNREVMLITLDDRLRPADQRDPGATGRAVLAALEIEGGGWNADERSAQIAALHERIGARSTGAAATVGIAGSVPAAAQDQYHRAEQLLAAGDPAGAANVLEPLLAAYPAHAEIRVLSCRIELLRGGVKSGKAIAICDRAASLSSDIEPALAVAAARIAAGDPAGARTTLAAAETRIANLPPERAAAAWLVLASHYQGAGALTWAELAVSRSGAPAGAERGVSAWAAMTRARYGIPRDGARCKLAPGDEAAAVAAVRGALALVNTNKFDAAARAIATAEKRWPALPGLVAVRCDLEMRRGSLAAARQLCDRAIAKGESSWALYLRGIIDLRGEGAAASATGIAHLRAAIELDPDLGQAWRALGKALARTQATAELDKLRQDYRARFNSALPN